MPEENKKDFYCDFHDSPIRIDVSEKAKHNYEYRYDHKFYKLEQSINSYKQSTNNKIDHLETTIKDLTKENEDLKNEILDIKEVMAQDSDNQNSSGSDAEKKEETETTDQNPANTTETRDNAVNLLQDLLLERLIRGVANSAPKKKEVDISNLENENTKLERMKLLFYGMSRPYMKEGSQETLLKTFLKFSYQPIENYNSSSKSLIVPKYNIFTNKSNASIEDRFFNVSNTMWNKGIHELKIKIIDFSYTTCSVSIGILTNLDVYKLKNYSKIDADGLLTAWIFDQKESGITYQFYCKCPGGGGDESGSYEHDNGTSNKLQEILLDIPKKNDALDGNYLSLVVDFNQLNIQFFFNDNPVSQKNNIQKQNYYPAIVFTGKSKFQLITSTSQI